MMKGRPSYAYSEKVMKQMGWTEGKGLGRNEDGMRDFIQPKKKVNTKGIGFNGVDNGWIEHQEAFDSLLSNLNDGSPAAKEDKLIGVEERAFKLGGRVHYSKFLREKDLSRKKKEDLNAIVVKRKRKDVESVQEADMTGQEDLSGLKTYTSSLSYQEYFAQRMKALRHHKGLNEDADLQSCQQAVEPRHEDSETRSRRKDRRAGNAARKHQKRAERPYPWCLDRIKKGMWRPLFKPDVKVVPVDDDTARTMSQWVIDTVEHSGSRITPAKACHLSKEMFAMTLTDHIYRQHNVSNWMHIPGYGSKSWVEGCVNLLCDRLVARNCKQASESFVQSTAGSGMKK
ncbi:PIN2/TERF1-interacting telomerase inhibitor 1-like isoform X2 [Dermacentor variabilis]|uniref:PIN2/TERF1-interacting telomerase inhibitor 1-like isoform X2 n=1 Tax=Dermacentor variabilis TaxID=34621 RepID=UPI003F5C1B24